MNEDIKKYTFVDWTQMVPGAIIGGFVMTPGGLGLGSGWAKEMSSQSSWKRICISEFHTNIRDKFPVVKISRTGVSIYYTNNKDLNDILFDSKIENGKDKVNYTAIFIPDEPLGIFLGNILRIEGETYVNILINEGIDVWICDQTY